MPNPSLAPELLDLIVELLHSERDALRSCSLASRSWVDRARRVLFSHVEFRNNREVQSWSKMFWDPETTPARHARELTVVCSFPVAATNMPWISTFSAVRHFTLGSCDETSRQFLLFHGFSPVLESLRVLNEDVDPSNLVDLTLSFPLLRDLEVRVNRIAHRTPPYGWVTELPDVPLPSRFPALAGTLALDINSGLRHIAPMLLSPDGSLCVRRLELTVRPNGLEEGDLRSAADLVNQNSSGVKSLKISSCKVAHYLDGCEVTNVAFSAIPDLRLDLSRAQNLERLELVCLRSGVEWVTEALRTVAPNRRNLDLLLENAEFTPQPPAENHDRQRADLDEMLVQLSESHLVRPKIVYHQDLPEDYIDNMWGEVGRLFPEAMGRGILERTVFPARWLGTW